MRKTQMQQEASNTAGAAITAVVMIIGNQTAVLATNTRIGKTNYQGVKSGITTTESVVVGLLHRGVKGVVVLEVRGGEIKTSLLQISCESVVHIHVVLSG